MLRIEKYGHQGLPNAEPEGWKNADPEDYQKQSLTFAKCGDQELHNVIAEIYILRNEKCGHWGLPNAEPEGWKNVDPKDYQKWSPRIARCRSRELNNVIAETQEILMMIVEKCGYQGLPHAEPEGWKNADPKDYQKWSPRIKQCDSWESENTNDNNWKMYMLTIAKCGHQGLSNADPERWKNADPEDYEKQSPTIAKCRAWQLNNVIADNQEILMIKVEKCTCWELKNADTKDYQIRSPRVEKMRTPKIMKSGAWELSNADPKN